MKDIAELKEDMFAYRVNLQKELNNASAYEVIANQLCLPYKCDGGTVVYFLPRTWNIPDDVCEDIRFEHGDFDCLFYDRKYHGKETYEAFRGKAIMNPGVLI